MGACRSQGASEPCPALATDVREGESGRQQGQLQKGTEQVLPGLSERPPWAELAEAGGTQPLGTRSQFRLQTVSCVDIVNCSSKERVLRVSGM